MVSSKARKINKRNLIIEINKIHDNQTILRNLIEMSKGPNILNLSNKVRKETRCLLKMLILLNKLSKAFLRKLTSNIKMHSIEGESNLLILTSMLDLQITNPQIRMIT